jgi:hypothetical protein
VLVCEAIYDEEGDVVDIDCPDMKRLKAAIRAKLGPVGGLDYTGLV